MTVPKWLNSIHTKSRLGEGLSADFADFWCRSQQWFYFPQKKKKKAVQSRGDNVFSAMTGYGLRELERVW